MGVHVLATLDQSRTVVPADRPAVAAPAAPREADPSGDCAAKISARLLQAHGAYNDHVQGHAA